jgi:hypothetical protein
VARRSARARRKAVAPEPTSQLVDATLRWLRLDDTVRGLRAVRAFGVAAGARILKRARAERLRGHTLYVRVATAAWSQELHMMRASILERVRAIPGGEEIEALRFEVGDIDALPDWSAPLRRAPAAPAAATPTEPPLPAAVHEALAGVGDVELRKHLGELFARASQRRR